MFIAAITLGFQLHGCSSLKEKRQRLSGLRDKFGKQAQIAVCESNYQDQWQLSEWSFVIAATDKQQIMQRIEQIHSHAEQCLDAVITYSNVEWL